MLVIHTKNNGEISEAASGKKKEELERLRKQSNEIDTWKSPYKAIVSVLMLKEGWDVRNVTVIVGLRAFAESNILPEQTLGVVCDECISVRTRENRLGHGYAGVSWSSWNQSRSEGVHFEYAPMGSGATRQNSLIVEVDHENPDKNLDELTSQSLT